ncbi:MAG: ribonuclease P protein component [Thermomicrobiales bacterium]|nr:ribonuclease P protein component [Thermomicrobiales bacterium]
MVNRELRLREDRDVKQTRRAGKAYADGPLVARILANQSDPPSNRYTVIAGKKIGKAHERNRCKRLTREAVRYLHPHLKPGYDVAIIVRGGVAELTGLDVAYGAMLRIFGRARLLIDEPVPPPLPQKAQPPVEAPDS